VPNYLTGREFVRFNAELQSVVDVPGATDRAIATVELDDSARPLDPHLFEGNAPAHQARRRPGP
jgi:hypothetical protein